MTLELTITGMSCDHCVRAVTAALSAVPGVERVTVSLTDGRAQVEGQADLPRLLAAVEEEGYVATATA
ncbi:MAG: heavy metal-associated domain-containing protein [Candidatus Sericytochromatia bacterium]|nr:heavy metal-associated domain-containing protein [Candidatus Sericytochromatia bacterium]